jgi:hexosaminidase
MNVIIPKVTDSKKISGKFVLTAETVISCDKLTLDLGNLLSEYLAGATSYDLPVIQESQSPGAIQLSVNGDNQADENGFFNEEYNLVVNDSDIKIQSPSVAGVARAVQTLRQLLPVEIFSPKKVSNVEWSIAGIEINDKPQFRWRGMHLDVARHFFNVDEVCRMIELFAMHRFNVFHWHLTEDQGWRIEIKKYPKLTEVGSIRPCTLTGHLRDKPKQFDDTPYGGFYTQEEIKQVIDFAARRHITIVPEIDMPGHMQAAITAYPELGNNPNAQLELRTFWGISQHILNVRESTIEFMQDVLAEVIDLFPSKFIHIGGDEALKHEWEESREAQAKMLELDLKDEKELQRWFITRMKVFIQSKGRTLIGWDEIAEGGLTENVAVMCWRGLAIAYEAAKNKQYSVNSFAQYTYFDYYQADPEKSNLCIGGDLPTEKVYRYNPIPEGLKDDEKQFILGGQGQLWTEYIPNMKTLEAQAFPRACALAEKLWDKHEDCCFVDFKERLAIHRQRLDFLKVNAHQLP